MKKMFTKIAAGILSAAMLCGIGFVSAKLAKENAVQVKAAGYDFVLTGAESTTVGSVTFTPDIGDGSSAPAWYNAGLRLYTNNTVTITSTETITSISFNWEQQGSKTFASASADVGTYNHPASADVGTWTGSASTVVFTVSGSKCQLQLNTFTVTTSSGGSSTVAVEGVSISPTSKTISVGESFDLTATVTPDNASDKTVTWSSSNTSVASVSNGKVTGLAAGTSNITVTTNDGSKTATCEVTVNGASESTLQDVYEAGIALENSAVSSSAYQFSGYVTALDGNSFFIQKDGYGIYVYSSSSLNVAIGDEVSLSALITKYKGFVETSSGSITGFTIVSHNNTVSPVAFASYSQFTASQHNILGSVSGLTFKEMESSDPASSTNSGNYALYFGTDKVVLNVNKHSYSSAIGEKLTAMQTAGATIDIVGAPIYNYEGANQFRITNANQISVTIPEGPTNTDPLIAKYDFSDASTLTDVSVGGSITSSKMLTFFGTNIVEGNSVVDSVSEATNVYKGYTNDYRNHGIRLGSSNSNGVLSFTLNNASVTKVVVNTAGWTTTDTLTINGITNKAGTAYSGDNPFVELTYILEESSTSLTLTYAKRGFIKDIALYGTVETPEVPDTPVDGEVYTQVTSLTSLSSGTYIIATGDDDGLHGFNWAINSGHGQSSLFNTSEVNLDVEVELEGNNVNGYTIKKPGESKYLYATKAGSGGLAIKNTNDSVWSVIAEGTPGEFTFIQKGTIAANLRAYNNTFRTYGNKSNDPVLIFKKNVVNYTLSSFVTEFNSVISAKCDPNGVASTITTSDWDNLATSWAKITDSKTPFVSGTLSDEASVHAINTYDYIVLRYGWTDFAGRNPASGSPAIKSLIDDASGVTTIVTVTAIASITLVGGFTLTRKRKHF